MAGRAGIALIQIAEAAPGAHQIKTSGTGALIGSDVDAGKLGWNGAMEVGEQIGAEEMTRQTGAPFLQGFGGWQIKPEGVCEQAGNLGSCLLRLNLGIRAGMAEQSQGYRGRVRLLKENGEHAETILIGESVKVRERELAFFYLIFKLCQFFRGAAVTQGAFRDDREARVARTRSVARLEDHPGSAQLDQRMLGIFFGQGNIDDQMRGCFALQQRIHLIPQSKETPLKTRNGRVGNRKLLRKLLIVALWVKPDHDPLLADLPDNEISQIVADDSHSISPRLSLYANPGAFGHQL